MPKNFPLYCWQQSVSEKASQEGKVQRRIAAIEGERDRLGQENRALQQKVAESSRALQRSLSLENSLKVRLLFIYIIIYIC